MRRRLGAVLRIRGLLEERRRADATIAAVQAEQAARSRTEADQLVASWRPATGLQSPAAFQSARLSGMGLQDVASASRDRERTAQRTAVETHEVWSLAARELRTVERLAERDRTAAALRAARRAEQQLDAAALEQWRRSS